MLQPCAIRAWLRLLLQIGSDNMSNSIRDALRHELGRPG